MHAGSVLVIPTKFATLPRDLTVLCTINSVGNRIRDRDPDEAYKFTLSQTLTFGSFELVLDSWGRPLDVTPPPYVYYMRFGTNEYLFNEHARPRQALPTRPVSQGNMCVLPLAAKNLDVQFHCFLAQDS